MVDAERSPGNYDRLLLAVVLVIALFLRTSGIDAIAISVDEANAVLTARGPLGSLFEKLHVDSSPPLFFLLLHAWIGLFGDGAVALRALSALVGVALTAATWWAGRALLSPSAGFWAAAFVAVSPVQIFYSQQVRPYALLPLLALLSVAPLVRYLREGHARDRALWLVATVAALYTHNFAIYLPLVAGVLILLSGRAWSDRRVWIACAAVGLLAWLPWAPIFLAQLDNPDHYAWFEKTWGLIGPSGVVIGSLMSYSPSGEYVMFDWLNRQGVSARLPVWITAALAVWGGVALLRGRGERRLGDALWPVAFLLVPIVGALVVSVLMTPHYVPGRVDQMMLPAYALLVGAGMAALPSPWLARGIGLAIVAIALTTTLRPVQRGRLVYDHAGTHLDIEFDGQDRALAERIAAHWRPGNVIVTTSLTRASIEYYLDRDGREPVFVSYPRDTARHLGSQNDAPWLADRVALLEEVHAVLGEARAALGPDGRLVVVRARRDINMPLKSERMTQQFGFVKTDDLGFFRQAGTGDLLDVSLYRPGG